MSYRIPVLTGLALVLVLLSFWPGGQDRKRSDHVLVLPEYSDLKKIHIETGGQATISLEKRQNRWVLDGDEPLAANIHKRLKESLSKPVRARAVATGADPSRYGLEASDLHVVLEGETTTRLTIGRVKNKRVTFVSRDESNDVFRVPVNLRELFQRHPKDWVEKKLFPIELKNMRQVSLETGSQIRWRVERQDANARWIMDIPRGIDAGQLDVDAMAGTLAGARATEFRRGTDFEERNRLVFTVDDGKTFALQMGAKDARGGMLVQPMIMEDGRWTSLRPIAYLPRHLAIFLEPNARDLRDRVVFPVRSHEVASVVVSGQPELRAEQQNGRWSVAIDGRPISGQRHLIEAWIESVVGLKSTGFVDGQRPDAFSAISGQVILRLKNDRVITLEVGQVYGRGRYGRTLDRPNRVFILSESTLNALRPRAEYFDQRRVPSP